jgi:NAD(P)-dependent dehydrogenase (short-subunit alcohol dehydrogenase family)
VARRVDRMADLEARGIHTFAMDVTDDASMVAGVRRVLVEQGRLDVLVNNAGYGSYGALEDVSLDEARRQFEVNVFGLARLTQLVTPTMREQGSAGSSTCPRSAAGSTSPSVPGTTPPSSRWRG